METSFTIAFKIDLSAITADEPLCQAGPMRLSVRMAGKADNFKIGGLRGVDGAYEVNVLVWHDRKADATIFDAEIGGMRTMICRREGKFSICAKAAPAWHAKSSGKEPLANDYRDAT